MGGGSRRAISLGVAMGLIMAGVAASVFAKEDAPAPGGVLDGKVFIGEIGGKDTAHGDHDEFQFVNGTFHSTACDRYGFTAAPYTSTADGETVTFQSETSSPSDGRMVWTGTAQSGALEGIATWYQKEGTDPQEFWFKASLKE